MSRSLLFIPGHREKMLNKACESRADALIFDLEDSVPPSEKDRGRAILTQFLRGFDAGGREVIVRVNRNEKLMGDDIESTISTNKVDGYMIPKADVDVIAWIDSMIGCMDAADVYLIPMVESPQGLLDANQIATSSSRIRGMLFGAEDYTAEMGIRRTKAGDEIYVPRCIFAIACHAAGIEAYDTPYVDTKDEAGLTADTEKGKSIGFTGRTAIHPGQLDVINRIYMPEKEEIEWARRVVSLNEEAEAKGLGAFSIDGQMIDMPVVLRAKKILAQIDR